MRNLREIPGFCCFFFLLLIQPTGSRSQTMQQEEVLLTFRHASVGHIYVNSLYDYRNNQSYLPLIELFSLFEINYNSDSKNFTVSGNFIKPGNAYMVDLKAMQLRLGRETVALTPEDFIIGEIDYYLSPSVFEKAFGLHFTVNMMHLVLTLETMHALPVQERLAREKARSRMDGRQEQEDFPMGYPRKRSLLSGAMLDYSLTGNYTAQSQNLGYNLTGGMEVLGGDLQGSVFGFAANSGESDLNTGNLRWRYAVRNSKLFSSLTAGQLSTTGLQSFPIKGVAITNDPIEPRRMYQTWVIDGNTDPESEVEIYINERLTGYQRADELGYYRFDEPLTYGTTRVSTRIYTPSGEVRIIDQQIQVPFTFLPPGVVSYNIQAGISDLALPDATGDVYVAHGNLAVGVNRWLTASAGTQHTGEKFDAGDLFYYGSLSARVARQYLLSIDAAPDAFYRLNGSVMYTNNLSMNFIYTRYEGESLFNSRGLDEEIAANVYLPFTIFGLSTGLRLGGEYLVLPNSSITRLRSDLNARLGRVNLRFNYRDNLLTADGKNTFGQGQLTTALTYTISRSPGVPVYVRGMFVRGQVQYNFADSKLQTSELQLSRTIFKTGRVNVSAIYNHLGKSLNLQFGFTFDLRQVRSATTINSSSGNLNARQSFTGSIGMDAPNRFISFSNRQQVGQSAASFLQFVDNNSSGHYDEGDELLPYRGINLDRTGIVQIGRDSILRTSQLQSYYLYNVVVNRNAIADPTLVPMKSKFSFIADPNRYKKIEIPYYRGGIIEGMVVVDRNGQQTGQGGLRLLIKGIENEYEATIRTFSDGGFYTMDLPPGKYTIAVDPAQLGFLKVAQTELLEFEIEALAEGDYIEGLEIILVPEKTEDKQ